MSKNNTIAGALEILISEGYLEPGESTFDLAMKKLGRMPRNKKEMTNLLTTALDELTEGV